MDVRIARTDTGEWHAWGMTACGDSFELDFDHYTKAHLDRDKGEWPGLEVAVCDRCTESLIDLHKR